MAELHPTQKLTALVPQYVQRFACVGPACSDSCCAGWAVAIDKPSFTAYRKVTAPNLQQRMRTKVHRVRKEASDASYAKIELEPKTSTCPFIEEHLCAIQRDLGESMLSDTCATYPRYTHLVQGVVQQGLTLSCPEAARLALLADDAFEFVPAALFVRMSTINPVKGLLGFTPEQINEARFFAVRLVRDAQLPLWQRLAILGAYCESLSQLTAQGRQEELPQTIAALQSIVDAGLSAQALEGLQANHRMQAQLFVSLWHTKAGTGSSAAQRRQHEFMLKGLGVVQGDVTSGLLSGDELTQRYVAGLERMEKVLADAPRLLENFVVNEMFRDLFPFGSSSFMSHYLKLVTRYGLLRMMLAIRCQAQTELPSPQDLVETVQVYCRRYQHDKRFAGDVDTAFKNAGWDELSKVYRFLRH